MNATPFKRCRIILYTQDKKSRYFKKCLDFFFFFYNRIYNKKLKHKKYKVGDGMTKRERIQNTLNGGEVDKVAFSMWTHLPHVDLNERLLAEETYKFYKEYDIDFIKTMNNGMYSIEDYGCIIDFSEIIKGGVAKVVESPILTYEDWEKIKLINIYEGAVNREINSLKKLKKILEENNDDVPILFTVFSPLTTAMKLSKNKIFQHISEGKIELVHKALENITETTKQLIREVKKIGIDGVFFATQLADYLKLDKNIYVEYGKKYDLEVLKAVEDLWFNVLHAHGDDVMFDILKDYPVQVLNWHIWESFPDIKRVSFTQTKTILGGLVRADITNKKYNKVSNHIFNTLISTKGKKIILSPGCVIRYPLDKEFLKFVKEEKEEIETMLKNNKKI